MPNIPTQPPPGQPIEGLDGQSWNDVKDRLIEELRYDPLDMENPPTQKRSVDAPEPMFWTTAFEKSEAKNPEGRNSTTLLNQIKAWELELPNMYAVAPCSRLAMDQ